MSRDVKKRMEASGWRLMRHDQPGIYVRRKDVIKENAEDWVTVPQALLERLEAKRQTRRCSAHEKAAK